VLIPYRFVEPDCFTNAANAGGRPANRTGMRHGLVRLFTPRFQASDGVIEGDQEIAVLFDRLPDCQLDTVFGTL